MGYYFSGMKDQMEDISIRWAKKSDIPVVFSLIQELAVFEKAPDQVEITVDQLSMDWELKKFVCFFGGIKFFR
jgi:N-acetylglutamate synthase-like GNAT family acetyltransferase